MIPSARSIAAAVAGGSSAAAVLAEHVRLHRESHPRLNALVLPRHDVAATEAATLDATGCHGRPLAGVPVSVKECFGVVGLPTTLGIRNRRGRIDRTDAHLVTRLRAAGAIVVGKANVPQAMYLHETDNPVHGRTAHPTDPDRGPGGSSGGDAALVGAGVVPLAVGNDLAGSIRQPAHACGICSLVPRTTALGEGGAFDNLPSLTVVRPRAGFLAREVADLHLAAATLVGGAGIPARDGPLTVGWWDEAGPVGASPAIRRAVAEAVGILVARGAVATRIDDDLATEAAWLHLALLSADGGADVRRLFAGERPIAGIRRILGLARLPRRWRPTVAVAARSLGRRIEASALLATGPRDDRELADVIAARMALAARVAALAERYDALVCPVSALPALRHGTAALLVLAAAPCFLANLLDLAAGSVPVTTVQADEQAARPWSVDPVAAAARAVDRGSAGLPVGVQVVALRGGEATVLECLATIAAGAPATMANRRTV